MDQTLRCLHCLSLLEKPKPNKKFCNSKCRERNWVDNNRDKHNARSRQYRAERYRQDGRYREVGPIAKALKEWMNEIKSQPCFDCGQSFEVCCMDFDHREGKEKSYNVASMFAHHYSRELIEVEIAKCDLVCANCHRIRTRDRRTGSGKYAVQKLYSDP